MNQISAILQMADVLIAGVKNQKQPIAMTNHKKGDPC